MKSQELRSKFLSFFESKQHQIVPSAPMVMKNDPTLLFTNAGMNQFKEYFLGNANPKHTRLTDSQKCLRVSGKHNDLEEVGKDTYHHTMFEMLGNWSIGDYFKDEAIAWAWEFFVDILKIDKDNLYVTIFEGDKNDGLEKDQEAYDLWKRHISEDRILLGNKKIISGKWEIKVLVVLLQKYISTSAVMRKRLKLVVKILSMKITRKLLKCGTWFLCSITEWQTVA